MRDPPGDGGAMTEADWLDRVFNTIRYFAAKKPRRDDPEMLEMQENCLRLFSRDTPCTVIPNSDGSLCPHYPPGIIIPGNGPSPSGEGHSAVPTQDKLHCLFADARFARTWSRFVCPVILHKGKWICRSATLARQVEVTARQAGVSLSEFCGGSMLPGRRAPPTTPLPESDTAETKPEPSAKLDSVDTARNNDIALLRSLGVQYICDLMVEDRKVKYGLQLTSSEKVDKHARYTKGFDLVAMPYPGCELFTQFRDQLYCGSSVRYNWDAVEVNAALQLPLKHSNALGINWSKDYQKWDLILITQNYMLLILELLRNGDDRGGGLLIHCISGWDRTPLFISLLRISLWADGEIHQSLSAAELLYLTLTYDWVLFGHSLSDRVAKGEEIMLFCFDFLKFITADKFAFGYSSTEADGHQAEAAKATAANVVAHVLRAAVVDAAQQSAGVAPFSPKQVSSSCGECGKSRARHEEPEARVPSPSASTLDRPGTSRPIDIVRKQMAGASVESSPDSIGSWNLLSTSRLTGSYGSYTETEVTLSLSQRSERVDQLRQPNASSTVAAKKTDTDSNTEAGSDTITCIDVFDGTNGLLLDTDEPSGPGSEDEEDEDEFYDECRTKEVHNSNCTSEYASSEDTGNLSNGDDAAPEDGCSCDDCVAHAEAGVKSPGVDSRAARLHKLRRLFLPMYQRCAPDVDEGTSWRWVVEMTRLLPRTT